MNNSRIAASSVFPAPPLPQAIARRPCRMPPAHTQPAGGAQRAERRGANAALTEGREDGGEGAGYEDISLGIAYGFL